MKALKDIRMTMVLIGLSLWVSGCAHSTQGTVFGESELSQIVKGKTTSSELMNILGTPFSKKPTADGGEAWIYFCAHYVQQIDAVVPVGPVIIGHATTSKQQQQNLTILLNKDKVVMDFTLDVQGAGH
ncbi:MAG: hypothetical protein ACLQU4_22315 [Limisphaerales bacterium]